MSLAPESLPPMSFQGENDLDLNNLLFVAQTILQQAVDLLDTDLLKDEQLTVQSKYMPSSTIGKHLRHARDHFEILLTCITSPPPYILNYDVRLRNTPMETSRTAARTALSETIQRLTDIIPTSNWNEAMTLKAVTPFPQTFQTTFARELWFGALHCIHHWSMVRVIAGEMNIKIKDECFGFAPSTLVAQGRKHDLGQTTAKI